MSIINSTSTSLVHPVRNQGAADPTAPTTIASPSSGCSCTSVMDGSLPRHGVTLGTKCSNGSLPVSFRNEADLVIMPECSNGRISVGPLRGPAHFSTPECSNGWEPASYSGAILPNSVNPSRGHTLFSTPECSNRWEPTSSSGVLNPRHPQLPRLGSILQQQPGIVFLLRPGHRLRLRPGHWLRQHQPSPLAYSFWLGTPPQPWLYLSLFCHEGFLFFSGPVLYKDQSSSLSVGTREVVGFLDVFLGVKFSADAERGVAMVFVTPRVRSIMSL